MLNSLWGKFAQRTNFVEFKTFKSGQEMLDMFRAYGLDLATENPDYQLVDYMKIGDTWCCWHQKIGGFDKEVCYRDTYKNLALAAAVTSNARIRLWTELNKLGDRVLYHDTDSIIYVSREGEYDIPEGYYLGEWEVECGDIESFVSLGPKTYAYKNSSKELCKAKGFTQNYENSLEINFENFKRLVLKQKEELKTHHRTFKYKMGDCIKTQMLEKVMTFNYEKGLIDWHSLKTYPMGYQKFFPQMDLVFHSEEFS
jgi:hypothetical protein